MKTFKEFVFVGEIAWQIKIAQHAAKRLRYPSDQFDHVEFWSSIQLILMAAANVSKIFWPPNKKYKERGENLRKQLAVNEDNILSDRKFRDHFAHYDERIEKYFKDFNSAVYTDLNIDPFPSPFGNDPKLKINKNREYNPLTHVLTFRGESFDLVAVMKALKEIQSKCSQFVLT
jgi:hypothetical protein